MNNELIKWFDAFFFLFLKQCLFLWAKDKETELLEVTAAE